MHPYSCGIPTQPFPIYRTETHAFGKIAAFPFGITSSQIPTRCSGLCGMSGRERSGATSTESLQISFRLLRIYGIPRPLYTRRVLLPRSYAKIKRFVRLSGLHMHSFMHEAPRAIYLRDSNIQQAYHCRPSKKSASPLH